MKNLTVNMPLAVPHQRPPSKYASHPYPVLVEDVVVSLPAVSALNITMRQLLKYAYFEVAAISPTLRAFDIKLESSIKTIQFSDYIKPSLKALDIVLRKPITAVYVADTLKPKIKALDIRKNISIRYYDNGDYIIKPTLIVLDMTIN